MPPGSSPVCQRAAGMLSLVLPPPQTPPSAPSAPERRGGEEEALRGCCWHSQLHQDPIPTPRVCSRAGAAAEEQPWPQRSRGGEMLTCSAVSPLLGPSSPSDSVSLTTPRAASSPASLPSRREQCRREQLAAEPTPLREGGRQHHGLLLLPSSRPHRGRIQQCQQPAPTAALLQGCCKQPDCSGCRAVPAQGKKGAGSQHGGEESPPSLPEPRFPAGLRSSCCSPGPALCRAAGSRLKGRPCPWPRALCSPPQCRSRALAALPLPLQRTAGQMQ